MSALKDLWPGGPLGDDQKVYDYILEGIKTKNYGVEIVTSAFVEDLKKLLHLKKSRHEPTPNSCLSREQLCHILGYLVCQMKAEDVSRNFQHALLKEVTDTEIYVKNGVWGPVEWVGDQLTGWGGSSQKPNLKINAPCFLKFFYLSDRYRDIC